MTCWKRWQLALSVGLAASLLAGSGCCVVGAAAGVAGTAVGAAAGIAGTAVGAAATVAGTAVGAGMHATGTAVGASAHIVGTATAATAGGVGAAVSAVTSCPCGFTHPSSGGPCAVKPRRARSRADAAPADDTPGEDGGWTRI